MKSVFIPRRLRQVLLASLLPMVTGMAVIYGSLLLEESDNQKGYSAFKRVSYKSSVNDKVANLSSTDFSLTQKQAKNEGVERPSCWTLQVEKLIRSSIFDAARIIAHSKRLTWFSQSEYLFTLSPLWHPSIPIAHRKLVI